MTPTVGRDFEASVGHTRAEARSPAVARECLVLEPACAGCHDKVVAGADPVTQRSTGGHCRAGAGTNKVADDAVIRDAVVSGCRRRGER